MEEDGFLASRILLEMAAKDDTHKEETKQVDTGRGLLGSNPGSGCLESDVLWTK